MTDRIPLEQPAPAAAPQADAPLAIPHDMATTLHRTLGQLLGDQDAQAIARVRELHREDYGSCAECTSVFSVSWPCPTIRALDQPAPAAATPTTEPQEQP
jgi:hypothetical protein